MSRATRLVDYLGHIEQAAADACSFTAGMTKEAFLADKRTQQAVTMSLIVVGEAATKVVLEHPDFAARHNEVPWASMKGMRNRMAPLGPDAHRITGGAAHPCGRATPE
ncbi:MAG: HepT-like ribonuclease domain-containing protein [Ramlibacter sp.]